MLLERQFYEIISVRLTQNIISDYFEELAPVVILPLILIVIIQAVFYRASYFVIIILLKKTTVGLLIS